MSKLGRWILVASVGLAAALPAQAERYELGLRLRAFERHLAATETPALRAAAFGQLEQAVQAFFRLDTAAVARAIDAADAALAGVKPTVAEAFARTLQLAGGARLVDAAAPVLACTLSAAYVLPWEGGDNRPRDLTLCLEPLVAAGAPLRLPIGELPLRFEVPIRGAAGGDRTLRWSIERGDEVLVRREQGLSIVADREARLAALAGAAARAEAIAPPTLESLSLPALAKLLQGMLRERPEETVLPGARLLAEAEAIAADPSARFYGPQRPGDFWLRVPVGGDSKRGQKDQKAVRLFVPVVPEGATEPRPIVVALHGAGGSENLFFDGYGDGLVVALARQRGWFVVAPRLTFGILDAPALVDALAERFPIDRDRVLLVGHSMGAMASMQQTSRAPERFAAVAALGGGGQVRGGAGIQALPFFVATGERDFARSGARALHDTLQRQKCRSTFVEYPDVEHLSIVQVALPDVFGFFDGVLAARVREPAVPPATQQSGQRTQPEQRSNGLHGYIGYSASQPPDRAAFGYGMGFYSAAWSLIDHPLAHFQIGLASGWILPDNRDDKDVPLAPEGTLARKWKERGPTWDSVFQTVEGGLGYWAGNRFRYGPPKFSMNATPQCYDYEIGSPGWSFFYDTEALPDHRLGIAQLSNRLLIPPDALPFAEDPRGRFFGYTWMALPFADPVPAADGKAPTGDQAWTCFLGTANFKGPIAYYVPETWSKIADVFDYPYLHGRGLDARPGLMGGGAMEINTVPQLVATANDGTRYSKIPALRFPVDADGRAVLVQDVVYWSKQALYEPFLAWRRGGPMPDGAFDPKGAFVAKLSTRTPGFDQDGQRIAGVADTFDTKVFDDNTWGLVWRDGGAAPRGEFPQYYRHERGGSEGKGERRVAVAADAVPRETGLHDAQFTLADPGEPFTSPASGAWTTPGPARGPAAGPLEVRLADGSKVTYAWYRFVDQPTFQQTRWSDAKRAELQRVVEALHRAWPIDRDYMPPPTRGELVALDPALLVTPPAGFEVGYVPIVTRQERVR